MDPTLLYLILALMVLVISVAGLWYLVPLLSGLPWIPAKGKRIRRALELAELHSGEMLYDLGSGDGRVVTLAAKDYGACATGIEISPVHCLIALMRIFGAGLGSKVRIRWGNMYRSTIRDADVVFIYLTQGHAKRIKPLLRNQLTPGARVVTLSSDLDGWEPSDMDSEELIFLYRMPPVDGNVQSFLSREVGHHRAVAANADGENES